MHFDWNLLCNETRTNVLMGAPVSGTTRSAGDTRPEAQRDYDRALFSTSVRRLQDKAQVFPLEPHDSVRTRLTHSLEVSNVAQSIARRVTQQLQSHADVVKHADAIAAIAATSGLIHDIGNPPFGHSGEDAMKDWFVAKMDERRGSDPPLREKLDTAVDGVRLSADFEQFDGNAQTLRLITRLQMLADFDGLSLTAGTVSAALKYTCRADQTDKSIHAKSKPGFFYSEQLLVDKVRKETGTGILRNPITLLVEAADDIVYSAVDLEDGIKKGALTWEELKQAFRSTPAAGPFSSVCDRVEANIRGRLKRSQLKLSSSASDEAHSQMFRTFLIGDHVSAVVKEVVDNYESIMSGGFDEKELLKEGDTSALWRASKKIAQKHVFTSPSILKLELMGRRVIHDLMDLFWEGVVRASHPDDPGPSGFPKKLYSLLSENYKAVFEHEIMCDRRDATNIPVTYRRLQLVGDYLCGMTDSFAVSLHRELTNG